MSLMRHFQDDPFFSFPRSSDFFGDFGLSALTDGSRSHGHHGDGRHDRQVSRRQPLNDIFDMRSFMDPFASMSTMMNDIQRVFSDMSNHMEGGTMTGGDGTMYSATNFVSYSNMDGNEPKIYQATNAVRQGPDGIRETRKTERSSASGIDKMAVGRHIKDRGHVITKQRDRRTGQIDEHQDYLGINEDEAETFDNEWSEKASKYFGRVSGPRGRGEVQYGTHGNHGNHRYVEDEYQPMSRFEEQPRSDSRYKALEYSPRDDDLDLQPSRERPRNKKKHRH